MNGLYPGLGFFKTFGSEVTDTIVNAVSITIVGLQMMYLRKVVDDVESGKAVPAKHELFEY